MGTDAATPEPPDRPGELLKRMGTSPESVESLANQAAAAQANPKIAVHGVSVTARKLPPHRTDACVVSREVVEAAFRVHNTPTTRDELHRTVELPNPVTPEVAELFNRTFGRKAANDPHDA